MQELHWTQSPPRPFRIISQAFKIIIRHESGNPVRTDSAKGDYLFVNNVRFWSMVAIVAVHCLQMWGGVAWQGSGALQVALVQLFKFGTIGFYFISGFLLGERLGQGSAKDYLSRRMRNTARPWGLWAALFTALLFSDELFRHAQVPTLFDAALNLGRCMWGVLFDSTYWFVPNFLLSLSILLLFRRFLSDWRFGCVLLAASFFYGINVYERWIPARHTAALFGFVFYQWLGVWVSRHAKVVFARVGALKPQIVAGLILITGGLAFAEAMHIWNTVSEEGAFNTLRISNQLYSLAVLLGLLKFGRATWPRFVDVRRHTFGLYLIHGLALFVLARSIQLVGRVAFGFPTWVLADPSTPVWQNPAVSLLIWGAMFAAVYGSSLGLSIYLAERTKWAWAVGQSPSRSGALTLNRTVITAESIAAKLV